jgi:hypothetical protein
MLHVDVCHFMSHHACQLRATWQSERIDFLLGDYMKLVGIA